VVVAPRAGAEMIEPPMIDLPPDAALVADTPRLRLVPAVVENAYELFLLLNDQRLHEHTGGTPQGESEVVERLRRGRERRSADGAEVILDWIVRLVPLGEAVGEVTATVTDDGRAELTWLIGRRWQSHGFAVEAAQAMVRVLEAHAGVRRLIARIPARHAAAQRVASHLAMAHTGARQGRWELWEGEATPLVQDVAAPGSVQAG
jgi:RimJ/RimL family protein N-acetyltransferase